MKPDYTIHELKYREARARGDVAWGGEMAQTRIENWSRTIEFLMGHPSFPKHGSLLEIGCGAGNLTLMMAERGFQISGVDISPTAIAWAQERAREQGKAARFYSGNVTDLSAFGSGEFNVVMDGNCLHCIIGEDRKLVLGEVFRVLKPGGVFFVSTNCGPVIDANVDYDPAAKCILENGVPYRSMGESDAVLSELKAAGFTVRWSELNPSASWTHLKAILVKAA